MWRLALGLLTLAGCAPKVLPPPVIGTGSAIILEIQDQVRRECRFRVDADTVGAILATVYAPADISAAICLAMLQSRGDPSVPRVNGVYLRGRFVR